MQLSFCANRFRFRSRAVHRRYQYLIGAGVIDKPLFEGLSFRRRKICRVALGLTAGRRFPLSATYYTTLRTACTLTHARARAHSSHRHVLSWARCTLSLSPSLSLSLSLSRLRMSRMTGTTWATRAFRVGRVVLHFFIRTDWVLAA